MVSVAAMRMRDDEQADEADRQLRQDERRDDVVDVGERAVVPWSRGPAAVAARSTCACSAAFALAERAAPPRAGAASPLRALRQLDGGGAARRERGVELGSAARAYAGAAGPPRIRSVCDGAEHHRRPVEDVEHEDQHADEQHDDLQRNLPVGAHQQRLPRFVDRPRGEVPLHLALVRAEVRTEQEQRRDRAGPEGVLVRQVEREVEALQPAGVRGHGEAVTDADAVGQAQQAAAIMTQTGRRR